MSYIIHINEKFDERSAANQQAVSRVAILEGDDLILADVPSALDLISAVKFDKDIGKVLIERQNVSQDFFDLSTGLAGEILQKLINYMFKIAIVGDFSSGISSSLRDFIYECNKGNDIAFKPDMQSALEALHAMK